MRYTLLNDKVIFRKDDSLLEIDSQLVVLQQKERDLLVYFIENKDVVLSKEDLLESVWGTKHRTDSTIKKTVFNLRDKLNDDATFPQFIKTIDRVGYRFIAQISEIDASDERPSDLKKANNGDFFSKSKIAVAVISSLAIVAVSGYVKESLDDARETIFNSNRKFLEKVNINEKPVFTAVASHNGSKIAYTEIVGGEYDFDIIVKDTMTGEQVFRIKNASYPAWSRDSNKIAYIDTTDGQCTYKFMDFKTKTTNELNKCADYLSLPSIEWDVSGENLFQFYKEHPDKPIKMFITNIDSGKTTHFASSEQTGFGYYIGHVNGLGDKIYVLENNNWDKTDIVEFDIRSKKRRKIASTPYVISDFGIVDDKIVHVNRMGGVDAVSINSGEYSPYLSSQNIPLRELRADNKENLIVIGGHMFFIELMEYDSKKPSVKITSKNKDQYPLYKNNTLYFSSNRTNIPQIYKLKNGNPIKVSDFKNANKYRSYDIIDESNIVFAGSDGIYINDEKILDYGLNVFFHDGDVYFTHDNGSGHQIFKLNIKSGEVTQLTQNGGFTARIIDEQIYITKLDRKGLWKIDKNKEILVTPDFPNVSSIMSWFAHGTVIYAAYKGAKNAIYLYSYDTINGTIKEEKDILKGVMISGSEIKIFGSERMPGDSVMYKIK